MRVKIHDEGTEVERPPPTLSVGAVLLVGVSISRGYSDKKQLPRLAEW